MLADKVEAVDFPDFTQRILAPVFFEGTLKSGGEIEFEGLRELVMATDKHEISALSSPLPGISRNFQQHLGTVPKVENNFARTHRKKLGNGSENNFVSVPKNVFFLKILLFFA